VDAKHAAEAHIDASQLWARAACFQQRGCPAQFFHRLGKIAVGVVSIPQACRTKPSSLLSPTARGGVQSDLEKSGTPS